MTTYRVLLNGDTTAEIVTDTDTDIDALIGSVVKARTKDENGFVRQVEGVLTEVLDSY